MTTQLDELDCTQAQDLLALRWCGEGAPPRGEAARLEGHLLGCAACRGVAEEISRLDQQLHRGFDRLLIEVGAPSLERVEATVRRAVDLESPAKLLRRVRRPFRLILWGVFFAFTLLASSLLAVAIYQAYAALRQ